MSFSHCPKCGTKINGAVACRRCGRMPAPGWPFRTAPGRCCLRTPTATPGTMFEPRQAASRQLKMEKANERA